MKSTSTYTTTTAKDDNDNHHHHQNLMQRSFADMRNEVANKTKNKHFLISLEEKDLIRTWGYLLNDCNVLWI